MYHKAGKDTRAPKTFDKSDTKEKTEKLIERLGELQSLLYAESKWSLLLILQGMDASGKDGTVSKVFSAVNPMGCTAHSFKAPSEQELSHDFLWRIHSKTPPKGMITIFNRSHYEDILVPTVHNLLPDKVIERRYEHINAFEKMLEDNNTVILKFHLRISREEQETRFAERLTHPEKMWKYQGKDLKEAKLWDKYMKTYHHIIEKCSPDIPWTVVPADQNWYRDYLVAKTLTDALEKLDMKYPRISDE